MSKIINIQLLCPSTRCPKCDRITNSLKQIFSELDWDFELKIVNNLDEMLNYRTAILPSLFVERKLLFVGVPDTQTLRQGIIDYIDKRE